MTNSTSYMVSGQSLFSYSYHCSVQFSCFIFKKKSKHMTRQVAFSTSPSSLNTAKQGRWANSQLGEHGCKQLQVTQFGWRISFTIISNSCWKPRMLQWSQTIFQKSIHLMLPPMINMLCHTLFNNTLIPSLIKQGGQLLYTDLWFDEWKPTVCGVMTPCLITCWAKQHPIG